MCSSDLVVGAAGVLGAGGGGLNMLIEQVVAAKTRWCNKKSITAVLWYKVKSKQHSIDSENKMKRKGRGVNAVHLPPMVSRPPMNPRKGLEMNG